MANRRFRPEALAADVLERNLLHVKTLCAVMMGDEGAANINALGANVVSDYFATISQLTEDAEAAYLQERGHG